MNYDVQEQIIYLKKTYMKLWIACSEISIVQKIKGFIMPSMFQSNKFRNYIRLNYVGKVDKHDK